MANGQQGGGHQYSEEDVDALMNETARRAAAEAVKGARARSAESEDDIIGINPRLVKQLQTTVSVFNTLKDFTSGPLQKAIETKVGDLAAGVIEQAFTRPSGPPPRKDLVDTLLNSQFAYGLGSGLGQRAPELVESMGRTFGKDRAEEMIEGVIGKYGGAPGGPGGSSGPGGPSRPGGPGMPREVGPNPSGPPPEQQRVDKQQTEMELLLSLDPNNPEHVAAYAESQGGLPVDTARKMLMIHQDAFIERMEKQGEDVSQISMSRGSHTEKPPSKQDAPVQPRHQEPPPKQASYVQSQQTDIGQYPGMEYAEYQDVEQIPGPNTPTVDDQYIPKPNSAIDNQHIPKPNSAIDNQHIPKPNSAIDNQHVPKPDSAIDNQQTDALKHFADDIGKIMGDMVTRVESLNNTVFVLQNELNELKMQGVPKGEISPVSTSPASTAQPAVKTPTQTIGPQSQPVATVALEEQPPSIPTWQRSEEFFEEKVQDMSDFVKELEEETKHSRKLEKQQEVKTSIKDSTHIPPQPQPVVRVPPIPSPTVKQTPQHVVQPIDMSNVGEPKIEKVEVGEESKNAKESKGRDMAAKDEKSDKEKIEDIKYVTPISSRNISAPSFKKTEESESSKDNNTD
jgi:hypothetical protein